jgi:hypothetical protein
MYILSKCFGHWSLEFVFYLLFEYCDLEFSNYRQDNELILIVSILSFYDDASGLTSGMLTSKQVS